MTESSNNQYSAADFERYHAGKMSAAEMHALEKAAMEDPFLADALEGYSHATTPGADIASIRPRLFGEENNEVPVVAIRRNYSWLRVAAACLFILGGTWVAVRLINHKNEGLALKQETAGKDSTPTQTAKAPRPVLQDSAAPLNPELSNDRVAMQTYKWNDRTGHDVVSAQDSIGTGRLTFGATLADQSVVGNVQPDTTVSARLQGTTAGVLTPATRSAIENKDLAYNSNNATVYNNINTKMPLPGYNNVFKPDLSARRQDTSALLYKGEKEKASADTVTNLNIVLKPDNTNLSEVVVSHAPPAASTSKKYYTLTVDTLEPKEGWQKFDDYIARNIQIPVEETNKQPYSGEVELAFEVNSSGEPVNIKVTRSLCNKCDEEAVRLLKAGPRWIKKKSKKGRVTIRF